MYDCNGAAQQQWIVDGSQLRVYANECLDVVGGGTEDGTPIQVWPCNGNSQQQWTWGPDGTIRSIPSGRCLDVVGGDNANGAPLQLWDCNGAPWQRFVRPFRPPTNAQVAEAPSCVVPKLRHLTLQKAKRVLARRNCALGKVRRSRRPASRHGFRVRSQSVPPASSHSDGFKVDVTLS
jgi:hypothetical protein